jgi:hypothetical protein
MIPLPEAALEIASRLPLPLGDQQLRLSFEAARIAVGRPDLHFHDLRHTYASWLVQSGVHLRAVQELLGHSTLTMTQRYSHLAPEHLRDAVRTMERDWVKYRYRPWPNRKHVGSCKCMKKLAEREGFEPPVGRPTTVFKTAAFDRSATSPRGRRQETAGAHSAPMYQDGTVKLYQEKRSADRRHRRRIADAGVVTKPVPERARTLRAQLPTKWCAMLRGTSPATWASTGCASWRAGPWNTEWRKI